MPERYALTETTKQELENAKTKGQLIGWIQGAGAVILLGLGFKLLGWIPLIIIAGVGGYFVYKVMGGGKK